MDILRILLADDNEEFRTELADYLRSQEGVQLIGEAKDGLEAVYYANASRPDLILMDITMPGMSGIEAARQIKEHSPAIKIVFVTVHEEMTYQALAETLGADGFICKSNLKRDLPTILEEF